MKLVGFTIFNRHVPSQIWLGRVGVITALQHTTLAIEMKAYDTYCSQREIWIHTESTDSFTFYSQAKEVQTRTKRIDPF